MFIEKKHCPHCGNDVTNQPIKTTGIFCPGCKNTFYIDETIKGSEICDYVCDDRDGVLTMVLRNFDEMGWPEYAELIAELLPKELHTYLKDDEFVDNVFVPDYEASTRISQTLRTIYQYDQIAQSIL